MPGIFEAEAVGHLRDGFSGRQSVFDKPDDEQTNVVACCPISAEFF